MHSVMPLPLHSFVALSCSFHLSTSPIPPLPLSFLPFHSPSPPNLPLLPPSFLLSPSSTFDPPHSQLSPSPSSPISPPKSPLSHLSSSSPPPTFPLPYPLPPPSLSHAPLSSGVPDSFALVPLVLYCLIVQTASLDRGAASPDVSQLSRSKKRRRTLTGMFRKDPSSPALGLSKRKSTTGSPKVERESWLQSKPTDNWNLPNLMR